MSSSLALVISCSSAASGSAPGCAYSTMPSRTIISVGMEEMLNAAATSGCASVSTLPNTASGYFSDAFSKTGPNIRHGPHQAAQKSTRTRPSPLTVELKFSAVSSTVAIVRLLALDTRRGIDNGRHLIYSERSVVRAAAQPPAPRARSAAPSPAPEPAAHSPAPPPAPEPAARSPERTKPRFNYLSVLNLGFIPANRGVRPARGIVSRGGRAPPRPARGPPARRAGTGTGRWR